MSMMNYLLIVLGLSVAVYLLYRHVFFSNPPKDMPNKPHFTLKIEPE